VDWIGGNLHIIDTEQPGVDTDLVHLDLGTTEAAPAVAGDAVQT